RATTFSRSRLRSMPWPSSDTMICRVPALWRASSRTIPSAGLPAARRPADDFEFHLLAERAADIAHHARETLDAIGKRPHPHGERLVIQAVSEVGRAA